MSLLGRRTVLLFRGDGIGSEIVSASQRVVDAALRRQQAPPMQWLERDAGPGLCRLSEGRNDHP